MRRMPAATICRPGRRRTRGGHISARPAKRFDVPEIWVRSVMRVESGGNQYLNGQLITSSAGAMGLMQVMPETYEELRDRYSLGDDPFDPHDNILAGAAYLREMYDIYGSPGFLAAYNAGPRRLDDYLSNNRPLPDETRRYVAMIGPNIVGVYPSSRSPAEDYAMNALPIDIPPGTRYGRAVQLASSRGAAAGGADAWTGPGRATGRADASDGCSRARSNTRWCYRRRHRRRVAGSGWSRRRSPSRCRCIAAVPPTGQWAIQVGAYSNEGLAHAAVGTARERARAELAVGASVGLRRAPGTCGVCTARG